MIFGITVQKKEVWNMAKHGLEDVSVVWLFMLALYVHQNGSDGAIFNLSCECLISSWEKHLEHGKPCFGRCFCCLVIYLNLHGCPVCASKSFQKSICFFSDVIRTWQHMVWKAFLMFCGLCQSSQLSM